MLSKYSVKKPYSIVVAIIIVLILGVVSYTKMTMNLIPDMNMPYAVVATTYIGASPEQVETVVTSPLEQQIATINNIKNIYSNSNENMSLIWLEFNSDTNMDTALIEMRENIDILTTYLPDEVGSPMILRMNPDMMPIYMLSASVEGMSKQEASKYVEDKIIPEIKSVDGVASAYPSGVISNMIDVTISQEKLDKIQSDLALAMSQMQDMDMTNQSRMSMGNMPENEIPTIDMSSFEITKEMIAGILKGQNFSMPSGSVSSDDGTSYLVRVGDEIESVEELEDLVVMSLPMLGDITLSDVAEINLYDNSDAMYSKLNGEHSFMITIQKQSDYSITEVSKSVDEKLEEIKDDNSSVNFTAVMNQGEYIDTMIGTIVKNLLIGALLAIIILLLFLKRIKPTLIVGTSIVISVITTFVLMYFAGVTLNLISMGGLALGVGMLVDNSIVVIENIYRMRSEGKPIREAAIEGAKEVSGAITTSTLTTIIVFVPIIFTTGITIQLFADLALTIAFSLVASLLVALTLVPAASGALLRKQSDVKSNVINKIDNKYIKILDKSLNHKWISFVIVIILFIGSIAAAFSSGIEFFPSTDSGEISLSIEMPDNYSKEDIYASLDELYSTINTIEDIDILSLSYSESSTEAMESMFTGNGISGYVLLKEDHKKTTNQIADEIREITKDFDYEVSPSSSSVNFGSFGGSAISIDIYGNDLDNLRQTAKEVADMVSTVEGAVEVDNGLGKVKQELRIVVDKDKAIAKGLTVAQVYMAVSEQLISGKADISITENEVEYDVFVKDEINQSFTNEDLENILIESPMGGSVKVSEIAQIVEAEGFAQINHSNQERYITVSGSIKDGYDIGEINNEIEDNLESYNMPSGSRYEISGEMDTINDTFKDLFLMLALAILFIYLVMVAQFQSLKSPFIIMFTIPLAFTGGFLALFFTGTKVSVISLIGLVVLVGVVVNNGIVFVDYANQQVKKGLSVREALLKSGKNRLRPILMTALTTIFALLISAVNTGEGAELLKPMAITTIGGLIYATVLTLFLVPSMYAVTHRTKKKKAK